MTHTIALTADNSKPRVEVDDDTFMPVYLTAEQIDDLILELQAAQKLAERSGAIAVYVGTYKAIEPGNVLSVEVIANGDETVTEIGFN